MLGSSRSSVVVASVSCFLLTESVPSFPLTRFVAVAGRWCATEHSRTHGPTCQTMNKTQETNKVYNSTRQYVYFLCVVTIMSGRGELCTLKSVMEKVTKYPRKSQIFLELSSIQSINLKPTINIQNKDANHYGMVTQVTNNLMNLTSYPA